MKRDGNRFSAWDRNGFTHKAIAKGTGLWRPRATRSCDSSNSWKIAKFCRRINFTIHLTQEAANVWILNSGVATYTVRGVYAMNDNHRRSAVAVGHALVRAFCQLLRYEDYHKKVLLREHLCRRGFALSQLHSFSWYMWALLGQWQQTSYAFVSNPKFACFQQDCQYIEVAC